MTNEPTLPRATIARPLFLTVCMVAVLSWQPGRDDPGQPGPMAAEPSKFGDAAFGEVLERHDSYRDEFRAWRNLFAQHADAMAALVKTLPRAEAIDAAILARIFVSRGGSLDPVDGEQLFEPWAGRWSGTWSNGTNQYHVWDRTQLHGHRWVQTVSQSESRFVDGDTLREMLENDAVDVAVNVFAADTAITGWVSKRQYAPLELPHIGYRVDATTLIWITQVKHPEHLLARQHEWFLFLETVDSATQPTEYSIHGMPFRLDTRPSWDPMENDKHRGTYQRHESQVGSVLSHLPRTIREGGAR